MSLQFILGNSGSGKTRLMFGQILKEAAMHPTKNYLVIVPEQFTLQTQKHLVEMSYGKAIMNIDVLSFKRLAYRIFDELGVVNPEVLEETGMNLVLRKVASDSSLTIMKPNMNKIGYVDEVKSLISEFMQYNIGPDELDKYINEGSLSPVLEAKLRDIKLLYQGFNDFISDRYITANDILSILIDRVEDSAILANCQIYFDEFTGFTPVQYNLLNSLLKVADKITVSASIDAREDIYKSRGIYDLFDMTKKTIEKLTRLADANKIEVLEPVILDNEGSQNRFTQSKELLCLEQNLFRSRVKPYKSQGPTKDIKLVKVPSAYDELVHVARAISRLVMEENYSYRDIAVVSGNTQTYANYARDIFLRYHIPYFLDCTKDALFNPFIEFIRALLDVLKQDFSYESVFRLLRCGYFDVDFSEIDIMENYVLATGIKGRNKWSKVWTRQLRNSNLYDLDRINEIRQTVYEAFEPVIKVFADKKSCVRDQLRAIYLMIVSLHIEEKLETKAAAYQEAGDQSKAKEYEQIYRVVMNLFDKYVMLMGEETVSLKEFVELLEAGLETSQVGAIPPGYDSVTIGDIERSRLSNVKILFFLGVNEGIIPANSSQPGIISEYEREALKELDMDLAPGAREKTFTQRFYLYLNMTKPSEKLYVSYIDVNSEGKAVQPSYLVGVLRKIFPEICFETLGQAEGMLDCVSREAALKYIINGDRDEDWYAMARYFFQEEESREYIEKLLDVEYKSHSDDPISKAVARAIYGKDISCSVTRLEKFARCAYSHFLQYGLNISEREESSFSSREIGNIYHAALEEYGRLVSQSAYNWTNIPEEEKTRLTRNAMAAALDKNNINRESNTAAELYMIKRMEGVLDQTIWALTSQLRSGEFEPAEYEFKFADERLSDSVNFKLEDDASLSFRGQIDRIDKCYDDGKVYIKVIDYKSGSTTFDIIKLYRGLQLQLLVYMSAAKEASLADSPNVSPLPGAIFYYHIDDPTISLDQDMSEEEIQENILKALKPDGLVNSDEAIYRKLDMDFDKDSLVIPVKLKNDGSPSSYSKVLSTEEFETLEDYTALKIKDLGNRIINGQVEVSPVSGDKEDGCKYCQFQPICGIKSGIPGYETNKLKKLEKEAVLELMRTEIAGSRADKEED